MSDPSAGERVPVLYIAPWVDFGGTDTGTIDWFRHIDRDAFAPSLITTQPSPNRRVGEIAPHAEEIWILPELMEGGDFPRFILDFIHSRRIQVVHLMNSRLGYNLLADIRNLPDPPVVVVQLHVEEPDRSGYVRYVTTRYGNLVDAFSITSRHLRDAITSSYEIGPAKTHVIYTGVDAAEAFNPDLVRAQPGLDRGRVQILYPHRLVEQKDPLLMVEVAARLRDRTPGFQVQVLGDGHLEAAVRTSILEKGLQDHVILNPPSRDVASWYAASDLVLLTSVFEGVPYIIFEAMAMGRPVVAPSLPGNVELMAGQGGAVIAPRDDVEAYVAALAELIEDREKRDQIGARARERMLSEFSLEKMGREHSDLYRSLLRRRRAQRRGQSHRPPRELRHLKLDPRPAYEKPLVSIVIPCYDHGRYLVACVEAIRRQGYPNCEVIVVDDASTDTETLEVLDRFEADPDIRVIRRAVNGGPSSARNAALEVAKGRYILPVDSDNILLPDAVEQLVSQLQGEGQEVAFIYPNQQFFGIRTDYAEAPDYNLHTLLDRNYCDTCSLIDRGVFDAGVRYPEDIGIGHEDWDLVLQIADLGLQGRPALSRTLFYRKMGFTRSDLVDHGDDFAVRMRRRHPALYSEELRIKSLWSPALSMVGLGELTSEDAREELRGLLRRQSCSDAEVLIWDRQWWPAAAEPIAVRRLPPDHAPTAPERAATGITAARGRYVLLAPTTGLDLLADPAFVERVLRRLSSVDPPAALAFTAQPGATGLPWSSVDATGMGAADAWAVAWSRTAMPEGEACPPEDNPVLSVVHWLLERGLRVEWRHLEGENTGRQKAPYEVRSPHPAGEMPAKESARSEFLWRRGASPVLPAAPPEADVRWRRFPAWVPPMTKLLCRHRNRSGVRVISTSIVPPGHEYILEFVLGAINMHPVPGSIELLFDPDSGEYLVDPAQPGRASGLHHHGYLERHGLPLLDGVCVAVVRSTGLATLISTGGDDPLRDQVDIGRHLGFIEPVPLRPRRDRLRIRESDYADQLEGEVIHLNNRMARIHGSLPGRVYHKVAKRFPGLRGAATRLLGR